MFVYEFESSEDNGLHPSVCLIENQDSVSLMLRTNVPQPGVTTGLSHYPGFDQIILRGFRIRGGWGQ